MATEAATIVDRLTVAATTAIAELRSDLERDPSSIKGLTLELTIAPDGGLADAISYLERRRRIGERALLDHPAVRVV